MRAEGLKGEVSLRLVKPRLFARSCFSQEASLYWRSLLFPTKQALREPYFCGRASSPLFAFFVLLSWRNKKVIRALRGASRTAFPGLCISIISHHSFLHAPKNKNFLKKSKKFCRKKIFFCKLLFYKPLRARSFFSSPFHFAFCPLPFAFCPLHFAFART